MKTLGLLWDSSKDTLQYAVNLTESSKPIKRSILSQIARIYDPLGLIGPVLILAKITMQDLWKLNIDWDESVPQIFFKKWSNYYNLLLDHVKIPRCLNPQQSIIHHTGLWRCVRKNLRSLRLLSLHNRARRTKIIFSVFQDKSSTVKDYILTEVGIMCRTSTS